MKTGRLFCLMFFSLTLIFVGIPMIDLYAEEHSIDMTQALKDDKGNPAKDNFDADRDDPECKKCHDLTLGWAIYHALNANFPDERDLAWEQKVARSLLADKIRDNKKATLQAEAVAKIKTLVGKLYGGIILKQIIPIIDPNFTAPEIK